MGWAPRKIELRHSGVYSSRWMCSIPCSLSVVPIQSVISTITRTILIMRLENRSAQSLVPRGRGAVARLGRGLLRFLCPLESLMLSFYKGALYP